VGLKPYAERTVVPVERSKTEVEYLLTKAGASSVATLVEDGRYAVAFRLGSRAYRIIVPLPVIATKAMTAAQLNQREQAKRQRWRALALILRAKLEASLSGVTELETELLPYAVLPSGKTVAEEVTPRLAAACDSGRDVPLLPGV